MTAEMERERGEAAQVPMPGARTHERLRNYPPPEDWDSHVEYVARSHQ